jgi:hypothetical protein
LGRTDLVETTRAAPEKDEGAKAAADNESIMATTATNTRRRNCFILFCVNLMASEKVVEQQE